MTSKSLTGYAWLSIGTAIVTIFLKLIAYFVTGSVGLLSDALESFINLAAAIFALFALKLAEKPPDEDHAYGHGKAEYFSSVFEGVLIVLAAISIGFTAFDRLLHPKVIEQAFLGIFISAIASLINLIIAIKLLRAGKKHHSITLEADGHHLLTDVWTSVGVIAGVFLVALTKIQVLDPIVAILVAINIIVTGISLVKRSAMGFMDTAISQDEKKRAVSILEKYCVNGIQYHGIRTRQSGARRFISFHILVPGQWSVQDSHNLLEKIEKDIRTSIPNITVSTHIEPLEDPVSMEDVNIDRA